MSRRGGSLTVLSSIARSSDAVGSDVANPGAVGAILGINVTAMVGGVNPTVKIEGKVPGTTRYYTLGSRAVTSTGIFTLKVHPAFSTAAGVLKDALPGVFRVASTHAGAGAATYGVTADLLAH